MEINTSFGKKNNSFVTPIGNKSFTWYVFHVRLDFNKSNAKEILATSVLEILKFCSNKKKHRVQRKINANMPPHKIV